jgi:leucine dehydrogenase
MLEMQEMKQMEANGMRITNIRKPGYEKISAFHDSDSGLKAFISIHSTALGPAAGGVRMKLYANDAAALEDAMQLSRAMTYKAAMADLPLGGGKSVIVGDPEKDKSPALWEAFGRCLESLGGDYIAAEDMGTVPADMDAIARVSRHVLGTSPHLGGTGNPASFTARGVFAGIQASLLWRFGSEKISGRRVAIQGLGAVGAELAAALAGAGAELVVSDIRRDRMEQAASRYGAEQAAPDEIHRVRCDVFAPCAMGGALNERTVNELGCEIVAGSANNQVASDEAASMISWRGILYAPDYVINAGGIIGVTAPLAGLDASDREAKIHSIGSRLLGVYLKAERDGISTGEAANLEAEAVIRTKRIRKNGQLIRRQRMSERTGVSQLASGF